MFGFIKRKWKEFLARGVYPDDPEERRKIKAYILGAGIHITKPGPFRVEIENGNK